MDAEDCILATISGLFLTSSAFMFLFIPPLNNSEALLFEIGIIIVIGLLALGADYAILFPLVDRYVRQKYGKR